ncbi:MAG: hypothetical protein H6591_03655 [Flavobacteriales bacterium]|nr:hypothetical protein [Flavobacteriales bacterium]
MLADEQPEIRQGELEPSVQDAYTSRAGLINFIASQLPVWRDDSAREQKLGEVALTHQLCTFLNAAAYHSDWSHVQFRTEVPDEVHGSRSIDMTIQPLSNTSFVVEQRWLTVYDVLLPIECKRLPTPREKDRDEREYVTTEPSSSGGIQRFKIGAHGAKHPVAAIIGYVQSNTHAYWFGQVNGWVGDLVQRGSPGWASTDALRIETASITSGISTYCSKHVRINSLPPIELHHLWVSMPSS